MLVESMDGNFTTGGGVWLAIGSKSKKIEKIHRDHKQLSLKSSLVWSRSGEPQNGEDLDRKPQLVPGRKFNIGEVGKVAQFSR